MQYIPYNSRNGLHKDVFGAVEQGQTVKLRVVLPRAMNCSSVILVVRNDRETWAEGFRNYFSWLRMEGEGEEWWTLDYTPQEPGLYWYRFECQTPWGTNYITNSGEGIGTLEAGGKDFQLTVYEKGFTTPDWLKGGIIYQIFPDRFYSSGEKKKGIPSDRKLREDWGGEPEWKPDEKGRVKNNDYFGGDIKGITEKLTYLKKLGISCIYLNPIFEANSNHRYDTADYEKTDPVLGDEKDFRELCQKAKELGISVILDGVFSHTGDDSVYFNKYSRYPDTGAYQSKDSPWYSWYKFTDYPDKYDSWWGIDILPEVNEENDSYISFIGSVAEKWLSLGARGWRLDVADELPDKFLDEFRKKVKAVNRDALILGEVWEDASNKFSYGERRRYLLGKQLDSVMNYPFASAVIDFIRDGISQGFTDRIMTVLENYPKQTVDVLMNHIGTHDTVRAITALAGEGCEHRDRLWQSEKKLSNEEYSRGVTLLKLASLIQFTLPGVPSVYYADEAGMQGYKDPFNRVCYPWGNENIELLSWYEKLGSFRRERDIFADGEFIPLSDASGCVAYKRKKGRKELAVIVNRNNEEILYSLPGYMLSGKCFFGGRLTDSDVILPGCTGTVIEYSL